MPTNHPHNFWQSLEFELRQAQLADFFYQHTFGVENIIRFNTGTSEDMEFQRADIDVQLHGWGRYTNVSEKFRNHDYDDLYLELYSMYPDVKGWMSASEAMHLAYFFPTRVCWLDKPLLIERFEKTILPFLKIQELDQFLLKSPKKSYTQTTSLLINGKRYQCKWVKAYNQTQNKNWDTIGICIPFQLLTDLEIPVKIYDLNNELEIERYFL